MPSAGFDIQQTIIFFIIFSIIQTLALEFLKKMLEYLKKLKYCLGVNYGNFKNNETKPIPLFQFVNEYK